jgi:hypothetical protein
MPWLLTTTIALAGFHFDEQLASWLVFSAAEIHYLLTGALIGLGTGFAIRKLESL